MQLLECHFDTAFAAPDGIKKLRALILTLAMQGKLVPQNPKDQPASELLKEIEGEKPQLVKACKIKQLKSLLPVKPEETPYQLPQGWEWTRLGEAMLKITDGTHHSPPNSETGDFLYISAKNIKDDGVLLSNATYVTEDVHEEIFSRCDPEYGNILYIKDGATTGIVTINGLKEPFSMLSSVALLKQPHQVDNRYLLFTLRAPFFYGEMRVGMTGVAITRVTLKKLHDAIIPLPPLPEQHRIVAKIGQLMARCDELEKLRTEQEQKRLTVHTAALKQLFDAQEQDSFTSAWQFITRHFGELYTVKENVTKLRKAILQLAVMGKLVPQDPNDPPASELLKEIEAEEQRLVKEGKIKNPKPLPQIKPEEVPFQLPQGWEWVRLGDLSPEYQNGISKRSSTVGQEAIVLRLADIVGNEVSLKDTRSIRLTDKELEKYALVDGNILITRGNGSVDLVGTFIRVRRVQQPFTYCDHFIRMQLPLKYVDVDYLHRISKGSLIRCQIEGKFVTTAGQKTVNQTHITTLVLPFPPLSEQHCIVAKIDQLEALCDSLEQQIDAAAGKQTELLSAFMAKV